MILLIYFWKHIIMVTGFKNDELTDTARKSDQEKSSNTTKTIDKEESAD